MKLMPIGDRKAIAIIVVGVFIVLTVIYYAATN